MPTDDYGVTDAALEQRLAEMSDDEFNAVVARTRPPTVDPDDVAASIRVKLAKLYNK